MTSVQLALTKHSDTYTQQLSDQPVLTEGDSFNQ